MILAGNTRYVKRNERQPPPRAVAQAGDTEQSRCNFDEFFTAWKNADPDIPVLVKAKTDYAQLERLATHASP